MKRYGRIVGQVSITGMAWKLTARFLQRILNDAKSLPQEGERR